MMIKNPVIFTKKKKIIAVASMLVAFCGIFLISGALAEDILPNEKDAVVLTIEGENEKLTWPVPSSNMVSFAFFDEEGAFKHNGVDIPAETGADVVAAMDATIITQDYDTEKGYYMVLEGQNYIAEYRHLSEFVLSEGTTVKAGDLVAKVGATGMATGPHVHFSLMNQKGEYLNPLEYSKEWDYEQVQAVMEAQAERNEKKKQLMGE